MYNKLEKEYSNKRLSGNYYKRDIDNLKKKFM